MRGKEDRPLKEHAEDWRTAIGRPEGITAVVGYMACGLALSLYGPVDVVPASVKRLYEVPRPLMILALFVVFDTLMWHIHYVQHRWRWLYYNTHAVHHTIHSPTMVVALTGYLPDTALLILAPLHATLFLVPANFPVVCIFATLALFHLHAIHSEFHHAWDPWLRALGLVDTTFHHGHHVRPRMNLAHFFVLLDKAYGTYVAPDQLSQLQPSRVKS